MAAKILDGRVVRDALKMKLALRIAGLNSRGIKPVLAIIQVGDRPDTAAYIKAKKSFGESIGVEVLHVHKKEDVSQNEILKEIKKLNSDKKISGIIIQLPLSAGMDKQIVVNSVDPAKDADGLTVASVKKWSAGETGAVWPATTRGVSELLEFYGISFSGKKVCVIGRSELVGTPIAALCYARGAIVTVCHSKTEDLKKETLASDIVISVVGRPSLITNEHVRSGQVIVDVGISELIVKGEKLSPNSTVKLEEEVPKRKLVGDVDFQSVKQILGDSGAITPVPGGVGPMTVLALFENLVDLCDKM